MRNWIFKLRGARKTRAIAYSLFIILFAGGITPAFAQKDTVLTRLARYDAATKIVTSLWDIDTVKTQKRSKHIAVEDMQGYKITGEDKYIKEKKSGKKYVEFQAIDLDGINEDAVAFGLVTNTLDRVTRYEEKRGVNRKVNVEGYVCQLDNNHVAPDGNSNSTISAFRFRDKYFLILGNDDYRYVDCKKLVGGQKVVDALMKGKPISEMTFFYELQEAGVISKSLTASDFTKLSSIQKQRLLNSGAVAVRL